MSIQIKTLEELKKEYSTVIIDVADIAVISSDLASYASYAASVAAHVAYATDVKSCIAQAEAFVVATRTVADAAFRVYRAASAAADEAAYASYILKK